ncbi:MAG: membrane protein insertase YidC [Chloroflexi bacterium]|nr:membrane protein insertase YidC [Chloroflexota bacterium]
MSRATIKQLALLASVTLLLAACGGATATASLSPTPHPPLVPAAPGADPFSLLAWMFTPVFQALFIGLVFLDRITGDIGISILILTLIIRVILISPYRKQLVSQKRTQLLAPEVAEIQRRYKGDKVKIQQAQMELYKSRGVSPFGGCLPTLLQFIVLIPMYTVISNGLTNPNPTGMLSVFGFNIGDAIGLVCANGLGTATYDNMRPCIEATVPWLGGLNASLPSVIDVAGFGVSILAIISAVLQVIQTRMTINPNAPKNDPMAGAQGQTLVFLPLISVLYGGILPAGLFIYWISSTLFSIVQQYLILGFGGLFPLFGWTPAFAVNHAPRFPVTMPEPVSASAGEAVVPHERTELDRAASAAATIRSAKKRDRHGRRGSR